MGDMIDLEVRLNDYGEACLLNLQVKKNISVKLLMRIISQSPKPRCTPTSLYDLNYVKMDEASSLDNYQIMDKNRNANIVRVSQYEYGSRPLKFIDIDTERLLLEQSFVSTDSVEYLKECFCRRLNIQNKIKLYYEDLELEDKYSIGQYHLIARRSDYGASLLVYFENSRNELSPSNHEINTNFLQDFQASVSAKMVNRPLNCYQSGTIGNFDIYYVAGMQLRVPRIDNKAPSPVYIENSSNELPPSEQEIDPNFPQDAAASTIEKKLNLKLVDYYSGQIGREIEVRETIPIRLLKKVLCNDLSMDYSQMLLYDCKDVEMEDASSLDKYKIKNKKNENSVRVRLEEGRLIEFVAFDTNEKLTEVFVSQSILVKDLKKKISEKLNLKVPIELYQGQSELKDSDFMGKYLLDSSKVIVYIEGSSDIEIEPEGGYPVSDWSYESERYIRKLREEKLKDLNRKISEKLDINVPIELYQSQLEIIDLESIGKYLIEGDSIFILYILPPSNLILRRGGFSRSDYDEELNFLAEQHIKKLKENMIVNK